MDNVLNKLRATFVIELTTADHNGSDSIVVEPLHVVIDVGLHGTQNKKQTGKHIKRFASLFARRIQQC